MERLSASKLLSRKKKKKQAHQPRPLTPPDEPETKVNEELDEEIQSAEQDTLQVIEQDKSDASPSSTPSPIEDPRHKDGQNQENEIESSKEENETPETPEPQDHVKDHTQEVLEAEDDTQEPSKKLLLMVSMFRPVPHDRRLDQDSKYIQETENVMIKTRETAIRLGDRFKRTEEESSDLTHVKVESLVETDKDEVKDDSNEDDDKKPKPVLKQRRDSLVKDSKTTLISHRMKHKQEMIWPREALRQLEKEKKEAFERMASGSSIRARARLIQEQREMENKWIKFTKPIPLEEARALLMNKGTKEEEPKTEEDVIKELSGQEKDKEIGNGGEEDNDEENEDEDDDQQDNQENEVKQQNIVIDNQIKEKIQPQPIPLEFASLDDALKNPRIQLLMQRSIKPHLRNIPIPLNEKQVVMLCGRDLFTNKDMDVVGKEEDKKDSISSSSVSFFETRRLSAIRTVNGVLQGIKESLSQGRLERPQTVEDLVHEEETESVGFQVWDFLTGSSSRRARPLKPIRRERLAFPIPSSSGSSDSTASSGKTKIICSIINGHNVPARISGMGSGINLVQMEEENLFTWDSLTTRLKQQQEMKQRKGSQDIPDGELSAKVCPFVEVVFGKEVTRTSTAEGTQPTWNETLVLEVRYESIFDSSSNICRVF